jgi:NTE family protein
MKKTFFYLLVSLLFLTNSYAQKVDSKNKKRPKIGLVLSGGGAKGFAHVGVLKVIDELGIPIDYISGTSMGSIIGGFYSIGYSAVEIEKMIQEQDWEKLLSDYISRTHIPIHDKEDFERYAISFPIKPKGIQLPDGIVKGQNVINLFERLSIEYHNYKDFRKFPIPFLCVATDLETGEAVVLDKGYLSEAMRASMAIPTFFAPVEIDGKLLADGGMINNFPVKELVEMGADIVIGVDVQAGPKSKEELNSFLDIINQTVSLMALKDFKKNIDQVDIYMKPKIDEYSVGSFNEADSLISRGEKVARAYIPELLALKKKFNLEKTDRKEYILPTDSTRYLVNEIDVRGLKDVSNSLLLGKLNLHVPGVLTLGQIKKGIDRAYGSRYFDQVDFQLLGEKDKTLLIRVKERETNRFNVGIHYDSDNEAGVLLNTTFLNKIRNGSRLSLDLKLAKNPRIKSTYTIDNGVKPGYTFCAEYIDSDIDSYQDGKKIGNYDFNYFKLDASVNSVFKESYSVGLGTKFEVYDIKSNFEVVDEQSPKKRDHFVSYYAFLNMDTHEKAYYPKTGFSLYGEYKVVTDNGLEVEDINKPVSIAYLKMKKAIAVDSKLTLYPQFYGRVVWGKNIPDFFESFIGGIEHTDYFDIQIPFVGLTRMEFETVNTFIFRTDFQYELFKNNYLIFKANVGKAVQHINDALNKGEWIKGVGLTYSYNSIIGPMEFTLMYSDKKDKVSNYVSLGYWF